MKYLRKFNESNKEDIKDIVNDCLIDIIQRGDIYVYLDIDIVEDITNVVLSRKGRSEFSFNEIKDSINQLISVMENEEGYSLLESRYYYAVQSKQLHAWTVKWFNISMDPTDGFVNGYGIDNIGDISDVKNIRIFELSFTKGINEGYWSDVKDREKDIWSDIGHIFLELEDDGFQITNTFDREDKHVSIRKNNEYFERDEVLYYLIRLGEYLNTVGYKISDVYFTSTNRDGIDVTYSNGYDRFIFNSKSGGMIRTIKLKISRI